MNFCTNCGHNVSTANFCPNCGQKIDRLNTTTSVKPDNKIDKSINQVISEFDNSIYVGKVQRTGIKIFSKLLVLIGYIALFVLFAQLIVVAFYDKNLLIVQSYFDNRGELFAFISESFGATALPFMILYIGGKENSFLKHILLPVLIAFILMGIYQFNVYPV